MGDWNGDDYTDIGVYQNGVWYLTINGNGAWDAGTDKVYTFGATGWISVLGDWNGNAHTDIGVYQNGVWYLDYNGNGAWDAGTDKVYTFGASGWTSVLGDWNGNAHTDIGVYQNGVWYLDYNGNGAWMPEPIRYIPSEHPVLIPLSENGVEINIINPFFFFFLPHDP